jgi:hypothetical protein
MMQACLDLPRDSHAPGDNAASEPSEQRAVCSTASPAARHALLRDILEGRRGMGAMDCPFAGPDCREGKIFYGIRRDGTLNAVCSCQGGILILEAQDEPPRKPPASWIDRSQPPED